MIYDLRKQCPTGWFAVMGDHTGEVTLIGGHGEVYRANVVQGDITPGSMVRVPFRLWLRTPDVASCDAIFDINDVTQDDLDRLKRDLAETRAKAAEEDQ